MTTLIKGDAVEVVSEGETDDVPGSRGLVAAVQEEQGQVTGGAPLNVVKPAAVQYRMMMARCFYLDIQPCDLSHSGKMLGICVHGNHYLDLSKLYTLSNLSNKQSQIEI